MKLFARLRSSKKGLRGKLFRYGWKITLLAVIAAGGLALFLFYGTWAQTFDMKKVGEMPERNTVLDVDGKIYSRLAGANRLKVSLNQVSPLFIAAVLAREDTRFYQHGGIDWRGILRALAHDILSRSAKEGASGITQQLARNSLPLGGRTISRKLLEAMVALRIERQFTKQQILELYINRIYFGTGCYGVETASQAYFGKSASNLNLPEAALLAGLIRSPNRFSPLKNPDGAAIQRNAVLDRMVQLQKLSSAQAEQAKIAKITPHPKRLPFIQENYAMDAVQRDLNQLLTQDQIDNGGLSIYPTLDPSAAWMTSQLMEQVLTSGTAASARSLGFRLPAAGKTGTTNDYKDAWFLGYTSTLTCGVWVGFDQPATIIPHGYGAALALPIWTQVMNKAAERYPAQELQPTMPIQRATVCSISNQLATTGCQAVGTAYDIDLPADKVPTVACEVHGGQQMPLVQQLQGLPQKAATLPNRFFRSFRKLFGGR